MALFWITHTPPAVPRKATPSLSPLAAAVVLTLSSFQTLEAKASA